MKILTFDIEDWFHILDNNSTKSETEWNKYESRIHRNMDIIFKLLKENNTNATFYCLGWIAEKHPDVIKSIDNNGYEIGCHSHMHQLIFEQTPDEFKEDLAKSVNILENITGKKIRHYRAPGFSIKEENLWALEILAETGIEYDSSVFPASRGHGGLNSFSYSIPSRIITKSGELKEYPINTASLFGKRFVYSGGGYFRLFNKNILNYLFDKDEYVMTYFHPRDFDCDQPVIEDLSIFRKFKSYYGLTTTLPKLDSLLKKHNFKSIKEAEESIDWNSVPQIDFTGN